MSRRRTGPALGRPLAAVAALAVVVAVALLLTGALSRVEAETFDARFGLRGTVPAGDVAVVAIDSATFDDPALSWPLKRGLHGRVIRRLHAMGVAGIAYDVQFTEPSGDDEQDWRLFEAVRSAPGTVLSTTEVSDGGGTKILGGDENVRAARAHAGYTGLQVQAGGVIRRFPFAQQGLRSFAVVAAERKLGRRVGGEPFGGGGALIDFHGPPGTIPTYSFGAVLDGKVPAEKLRGRVVVVGASAPSLQDVHPVPTSGDGLMPGPEVQANAISTVLRGFPLRDAPRWAELLATALLALLVPLAALVLRPRWAALLGVLGLGGWLAGAQLLFDSGTVLTVLPGVAALAVGGIGSVAAAAVAAARERRRTRSLFGRFVPEAIVEELLDRREDGGALRLGGVRQDATVLFCDLRGFTSFAERVEPETVIDVLNRYLSEISDAVLAHDGTVVTYLGDGVMAVFGSPVARADHADAALAASEEILAERLPRFNAWLAERGLDGFRIGIGLNSGAVMSGTVGSERRMEYAAVGDTTNVAARLQAATKGTPHPLFLSATTHERLAEAARARLVAAGALAVAGRGQSVDVWGVAAAVEEPVDGLRAA